MGRWSTGARTCKESQRIELSFLLKNKYLIKDRITYKNMIWESRGETISNINILSCLKDEKYIRLAYTLTDYRDNQKYEYDYKIYLTSIPSNLGKGEVLYFLCPETGKRCRVLYSAYGYHKWEIQRGLSK